MGKSLDGDGKNVTILPGPKGPQATFDRSNIIGKTDPGKEAQISYPDLTGKYKGYCRYEIVEGKPEYITDDKYDGKVLRASVKDVLDYLRESGCSAEEVNSYRQRICASHSIPTYDDDLSDDELLKMIEEKGKTLDNLESKDELALSYAIGDNKSPEEVLSFPSSFTKDKKEEESDIIEDDTGDEGDGDNGEQEEY